jgi:hypothetical protein
MTKGNDGHQNLGHEASTLQLGLFSVPKEKGSELFGLFDGRKLNRFFLPTNTTNP